MNAYFLKPIKKYIEFIIKKHTKILFFSVFFTLNATTLLAKEERPINFDSLKESKIDFIPYTKIYESSNKLDVDEVDRLIKNKQLLLANQHATQGFSQNYYWLNFKIDWKSNYKPVLLELDNPHIDNVILFQKIDGIYTKIGFGGDRGKTFEERSYLNRRYIFPLKNSNKSTEYFLMVDKKNASVSFPLWLWDKQAFEINEARENVYFGIYFGVIFFLGFLSLISGLLVRKKVFFYYAGYSLSMAIYLFTALGFSYQFLYPESLNFNNYSRVLLSVIITLFATLFLRAFLKIDENLPRVTKYFKFVNVLLFVLTFTWMFFAGLYRVYTIWFLNVSNIIFFSVFLLSFYSAFKAYKKERTNAVIFFIAFSVMILGLVIYLGIEYGVFEESKFPLNPILLGSGIEIVIFSMAMLHQLTSIISSKDKLEQKTIVLEDNKKSLEVYTEELKKKTKKLQQDISANKLNKEESKTIVLKSKTILPINEITHISSDGHYLEFHLITKKIPEVDRNTIKAILTQLPAHIFLQIHRSHIVNINHLKIIKASELILKNGHTLPISRSFKAQIKEVVIQP